MKKRNFVIVVSVTALILTACGNGTEENAVSTEEQTTTEVQTTTTEIQETTTTEVLQTTTEKIKETERTTEEIDNIVSMKPVIYLYPEKNMDINVRLDYNGTLTTTYPKYKAEGWNVTAAPDGTLIDKTSGKEFSYLFWEGNSNTEYDMSEGFVVAGKDTEEFLQEKLSYLGLTPREYNEFIVFWLPQMQNNNYNLITFQGEQYTKNAKLTITPKPDSVLRVYMTWKALDEKIAVKEQKLSSFERKGFTVVEWGGSEIKK